MSDIEPAINLGPVLVLAAYIGVGVAITQVTAFVFFLSRDIAEAREFARRNQG